MNEHVTANLSEYLDDELSSRERATIDAHVQTCAACADELNALRHIVAHAGTVAEQDMPPERDLWSGIEARINRVQPFPTAQRSTTRRFSFSLAQLAAAAVLLIAVSATAAWMLRGRVPALPATEATSVQAELEPTAGGDDVRPVNFADAQYDAAVSDLERTLQERRNDLDLRTVEILERNLKLIDAAIAQARQALEEDPGNTYLNRHLVESRRRKLDLLRRATAITEGD
jgi:anti-sigma factor RsiW